jgi:hypothetical protein
LADEVGREQAGPGQVQCADEKSDSRAEARDDVDRGMSPPPPDGNVGEDDQGQRQ